MKCRLLIFSLLLTTLAHAFDPTPETATTDAPFVNSLGMKFVPVKIYGGPTNGKRILFSIWDTRVQDFAEFAKTRKPDPNSLESMRSNPKYAEALKYIHIPTWDNPRFKQDPTHPVVNVTWKDAKDFCAWLTAKDRAERKIRYQDAYRIPTDHEWSCAAGIGGVENPRSTPISKSGVVKVYPWQGLTWPPPRGTGNFAPVLGTDDYAFTSPVGSFPANAQGLYDMSGNVLQWCEDLIGVGFAGVPHPTWRVLRGAAWDANNEYILQTSSRSGDDPLNIDSTNGFRCVLQVSVN